MIKVYLASGWFNPEQKKQMEEMYAVLNMLRQSGQIKLFAPFFDGIVLDPKNDPDWKSKTKAVWDLDIKELSSSDLVVVATQDHDVGTIFEAGFASALGIPLLCYNSKPELGLNLMLSQESKGFVKSPRLLELALQSYMDWVSNGYLTDWKFNEFEGMPI